MAYENVTNALAQRKMPGSFESIQPGQNLSADWVSWAKGLRPEGWAPTGTPATGGNINGVQSWYDSNFVGNNDLRLNYQAGITDPTEAQDPRWNPALDQQWLSKVRADTGGKLGDRWDLDGNYLGTYDAQDGGGRQFNTAALMFGGTLGGNLAMANSAGGATAAAGAATPSTAAPAGAAGVEFGAITPEMLAGSGTAIQGGGMVGSGTAATTTAASPGLWDTVKQGASSLASSATQSGGANPGNPSWTSMAKDAIPLVGAAATLASGGSVATPQVPDYVRAAIATGNAGKYDEQTPYGTVSWSLRPGADPANPQPGDYIRSTNFSPEQQQLYEQNTQNQLTAGQVGGQQLADLGQGRQAVQDALYRRATQYYDQNFGDQENQLRTRLANQGLNEGTEAFDRELRNFRQTRDSAYSDATDRAIAGADQQENNAVARIVNILNMSKATTPTSGNSAGGAGTDLLSAANQAYTANLGASNAQAAADAQRQNAILQLVLGGMKYYGG